MAVGNAAMTLTQLLLALILMLQLHREFNLALEEEGRASTPPRGWNSYDSFSWIISEEEYMQNAQIMADKLLAHGYEYAVVDFLWYRKLESGASVTSPGHDLIDEWGRPVPDPKRWPSSGGGKGMKPIAERVHDLGLKFGIHVMRGISQQAYSANTPILGPEGKPYTENGKVWRARDIALPRKRCGWMPACFMSVNTQLGAGRAFIQSLYSQYADWDVDFIKHDCIFGDDLNVDEISLVSEILKGFGRPILYSISPGTHATPAMAKKISNLVNMYRVTADDWDSWRDVYSHFNVARDFAASGLIGSQGLLGNSWPDLDMLPLGWLTDPGVNRGPHRNCALTSEEQKSQVTLWAMAKSPLMFGGDLRHLDDATMDLITNPTLLAINGFSKNNAEFSHLIYKRASNFRMVKILQSSNSPPSQVLKLANCESKRIKNWAIGVIKDNMNEVCWDDQKIRTYGHHICLPWRAQPNASLIWPTLRSKGQARMLESTKEEKCLDSSPNEESLFVQLKSRHFSLCSSQESQDWSLMADGALINHYSGLCAHISKKEVMRNADEARGWIASGPKGERYIALFNLGSNALTISVAIKDIITEIPSTTGSSIAESKQFANCNCFDVWNNRDVLVKENIVADVKSHGCALFVLNCS